MPELPEVETIKLQLDKLLRNKKIESVTLNLPKQIKGDKNNFLNLIIDTKIKSVQRRAKMLLLKLNNQYYLIFHLKMTGQLIYRNKSGHWAGGGHPIKQDLKELPNKFSHIIFNFSDKSRLFFNDIRQFGWVKIVAERELEEFFKDFGPEPLDKNFTFKKFQKIFIAKKKAIKPLLLEQKLLAGIGNIYATEACYCAHILPTRPANEINEFEYKKLYQCLRSILKLAIKHKGTSSENYVDAFGRQGSMNKYLKVYGRSKEKCQKCGSLIKNIKQGGRTTNYCAGCQK